MLKTQIKKMFSLRILLVSLIFTVAAGLSVESAFSQNSRCDPALIKSGTKAERNLWNAVKDSTTAKDFQSYLSKFPKGRCASAASKAIGELNAPVAAPAVIGKVELIEESKFNENEMVEAVAFSPSGNQIASGGWNNSLKLFNTAGGAAFSIYLRDSGDLILSVAFSSNGRHIVTGSRASTSNPSPTVKVWNASDGSAALALTNSPSEFCHSVAYSKNGERIAAGCFNQTDANRTVHVWDAMTGVELTSVKGYNGPVAISPDGTRMTGINHYSHLLKLFDTSNGNELTSIQGSEFRGFESVGFSPDGKNLVTGSPDGSMRIWDPLTGKEVTAIKGHLQKVNSVKYSPDGLMIASGGEDGSVSIWNAKTGSELWTVKGANAVTSISFSPDGTHLAVGGYDGIRLLRVVRQ